MTARNGVVEGLERAGAGRHRGARPHRQQLGLLRRPGRHDQRWRDGPARRPPGSPAPPALVPGKDLALTPQPPVQRPLVQRVPRGSVGGHPRREGRPPREHHAHDAGPRRGHRRGEPPRLGHPQVDRDERGHPGRPAHRRVRRRRWSATAVGEPETQRRTYPGIRGQYGTRGWELVRELDLPGNAPRIAEEARQLLTADACPALDATDLILGSEQMALQIHESVGHADGARPDPGLGGGLRRHVVARPATARLAPVRQRAHDDHRRCDAPRRPRQLRLRRRGHARSPGRHRARRHLGRRALGTRQRGARRPGHVRRGGPGGRLQPPPDGPHDQRRAAPRHRHPRRR